MPLINIDSVRSQVLRELARQDPPGGIELLSYKRNRSVAIQCLDEDTFLIQERGYVEQEMVSSQRELPRLLKVLIKREFPRSRKVRLVRFDHPDALVRERQTI